MGPLRTIYPVNVHTYSPQINTSVTAERRTEELDSPFLSVKTGFRGEKKRGEERRGEERGGFRGRALRLMDIRWYYTRMWGLARTHARAHTQCCSITDTEWPFLLLMHPPPLSISY